MATPPRPTGTIINQDARVREEALRQAVIVYSGAVPLGESGARVADDVITLCHRFETYLKGTNEVQIDTDGK